MTEVERDGERIMVPSTWQPSRHAGLLPELLEQGRQAIAASLKPAGDQGVAEVMMPLMLTTIMPATEGMSDMTVQAFYAAKASEYQRHLRDVPLDILKAAADACVRESGFFPTVADFFKHSRLELEKRKRQADRIRALIDSRNRPAPAQEFKPEPEEVRLRGAIWRGWRDRETFTGPASWKRASDAERRLAQLESREPAEWASEGLAGGLGPAPASPSGERMPPSRMRTAHDAVRAATEAMRQADATPPQAMQEHPPLPNEIPE